MARQQPLVSPHPSASARSAGFPSSAAVVCDLRAALLTLTRGERGAPVVQRLARKFAVTVQSGCDVVFQWVPSHVGLLRNETADALAKEADHPSTPVSAKPPRTLLRIGISRRARAFLLRLRTNCSRTAERRFRFTNSGSPSCTECPVVETTEHILLQCPGYTEQRRRLFDAYGRLGLPHVSLDHFRFPQAQRSGLMRAFEALIEFFGDADLMARLYRGPHPRFVVCLRARFRGLSATSLLSAPLHVAADVSMCSSELVGSAFEAGSSVVGLVDAATPVEPRLVLSTATWFGDIGKGSTAGAVASFTLQHQSYRAFTTCCWTTVS
ncbi:hypothetical protein MRX96_023009 [Rhipicephalus microplus]